MAEVKQFAELEVGEVYIDQHKHVCIKISGYEENQVVFFSYNSGVWNLSLSSEDDEKVIALNINLIFLNEFILDNIDEIRNM